MTVSDKQFALVITITYASIYTIVFLVTSIVCAYKIKKIRKNKTKEQSQTQQISTHKSTVNASNNEEKAIEDETKESNNDITLEIATKTTETKKEKWYTPIEEWLSLLLEKKKVYLALLPHLFDQATDFGIIYQYYSLWQNEDNTLDDTGSADPKNFFYASVFIILLHRIISTAAIYNLTRKWSDILLQMFDLMMVKAIWVNYKLNKKNKTNPQRFLEILEATFESGPQLLISTTYILKASTNDSQQITPLIIISLLLSLWSITSRVNADDEVLFRATRTENIYIWTELGFKYNQCPCINWGYPFRIILWRFLEITNRVFLCILIWVNLGGLAFGIILFTEFVYLLISSIINKGVDPMSSLMYLSYNVSSSHNFIIFFGFVLYRIVSNYIYLILVTIFAAIQFETGNVEHYEIRNNITIESGFGLFMLIYTWITACIWPCAGFLVIFEGAGEATESPTTLRTFRDLIESYSFSDVVELIEFGIRPMTEKDVINSRAAEYINKSIKTLGFSVNTLIILKYIIDIAPEIIDSKHKFLYPLELECKNGGGLIHLCVILTQIEDKYQHKDIGKKSVTVEIHNSPQLLEEIIESQNIDINSVNDEGQTALHCIALKEELINMDIKNARILLANGINKNSKDNNDETALDILQRRKRNESIGSDSSEESVENKNEELVQLLSNM